MQLLSTIAQTDLFSLIEDVGAHASNLPKVCDNIVLVVESLLDADTDIDLSSRSTQEFLKITLPVLSEALLRRNTRRYLYLNVFTLFQIYHCDSYFLAESMLKTFQCYSL